MSQRALDFLDRWEADHVGSVAEAQIEQEAQSLASICREDAIRAGIAVADLEAAANGDLVGSMIEALKWAAGTDKK